MNTDDRLLNKMQQETIIDLAQQFVDKDPEDNYDNRLHWGIATATKRLQDTQTRDKILEYLTEHGVLSHHIGINDSGVIDSMNYYTLTMDSKWWELLAKEGKKK